VSALKYPKHLKREVSAWRVMHRRCREPKFENYSRYGGAGITVCQQWQSFDQFIKDVGPAPSPDAWLGRLDTAGNYTPGNAIWTTHDEQMRRRQFCQKVHVNDQIMTSAEAARLTGMPSRTTVVRRKESGLSLAPTELKRLDKRFIWITHDGETLPTFEWAKRIGLPGRLVYHRAKAGMPVERILAPHRFKSHRTHNQAATEPATPQTPTNQKENHHE